MAECKNVEVGRSIIRKMQHVGLVVQDLNSMVEFFRTLGFDVSDPETFSGEWYDRAIGIAGTQVRAVQVTVGGNGPALEISTYLSPSALPRPDNLPINSPGYRYLGYEVADLDHVLDVARQAGHQLLGDATMYEGNRLAFLRGPEGIILELIELSRSSQE